MEKNWKLKLRFGKIKTPFIHYTLIAPVLISGYNEIYSAEPGNAFVGIKVWAENMDKAAELFKCLAEDAEFKIIGNIEIYETNPIEPPKDISFSYGINFSYYEN